MAERSSDRVRWTTAGDWAITPVAQAAPRRGAPAAPLDPFISQIVGTKRLVIEQQLEARKRVARRAATGAPQQLLVDGGAGDAFVVVVRHPSGALTFHAPTESVPSQRRGAKPSTRTRFSLAISDAPITSERRGITQSIARIFILKVSGKFADWFLPKLAAVWETDAWERRGLATGWVRVTSDGFARGRFSEVRNFGGLKAPPDRNLLLLHGTFGAAETTFRGLASTNGGEGQQFIDQAAEIYGDCIFGFNHPSVSVSPHDNARDLLRALPKGRFIFDVISHSRGGLVLRQIVERKLSFGSAGERFQLGHAILVASPNQGTPLASPTRWETMLSWVSNLMELFPENPFTMGVSFVSEALVWLAKRVGGSLPGISPMAPDSPDLKELQLPPGPPAEGYSALVANNEPDEAIFQRLLDAGIDAFFGSANDLVVPTEGGWRVDDSSALIPARQIGCFGPGGNIRPESGPVNHVNFFFQPETIDFLVRSLRGEPLSLKPIDPRVNLPFRSARRSVAPAVAPVPLARVSVPGSGTTGFAVPEVGSRPVSITAAEALRDDDALHLFIISSDPKSSSASLLAGFRNARVLEPFATSGGDAGKRWQKIIAMQERILAYIDGKPAAKDLPDDEELTRFGALLFETLFPNSVRRLYDVARAERQRDRLSIVFTSMIHWVADKPWEFAFDPNRKLFLATEETNFVRNVLTAVPADRISQHAAPLRILVAVAQPVGAGVLSSDEEISVIKRGFQQLVDAGLAEVEVAIAATPALLHARLESSGDRPFDVVHFIGHGEYDAATKTGYLLFEDDTGAAQRVDSQVLRQIVCRRDIRMVFLNACETGKGGRAEFNRGVAPALVAGGVPVVVANQYKVLDVSATAFAKHFYWSLAQGRSVGDAARESRVAVNYSIAGEAIDWAVPVVYARNPGDRLCTPGVPVPLPPDRKARRLVRAADAREFAVGLWDVNHILPDLEATALRMNRAQDFYRFDVIDISAPIGTWRLERDGDDQEAFLHGEKVAAKLSDKPKELGLNRLLCITSFRLGDDGYRDLYVWDIWDEDPAKTIAIISLAGLMTEIRKRGLSVARAVVNTVVGCLMPLPSHSRGPKFCPLYFNNERDVQYIAGPLNLDKTCKAKARKPKTLKRGVDVTALEKLLRAFD
ncbi:MAG TPA: CHAT domain-containing protein [Blastocatellia bacterium]|nr:CHAT domain-containing protein [Blastocatellia bacterium]